MEVPQRGRQRKSPSLACIISRKFHHIEHHQEEAEAGSKARCAV
jgi:hypothetical protein